VLERDLVEGRVARELRPPLLGDQPAERGYRRVGWIERAIEPLRDRLDADEFERLVSALAMVVGWEAEIVLQDLRGLDPDEELAVTLWSARTLIRAALDEHDTKR
jgi:hypothetical protein